MSKTTATVKPIKIDLQPEIKRILEDIGRSAVADIKSNCPVRTGKYRDGWVCEIDGLNVVVHNKTHYERVHLLEKGHAIKRRNGAGHAAGKPHVIPASERAKRKFKSELEHIKIIAKQ